MKGILFCAVLVLMGHAASAVSKSQELITQSPEARVAADLITRVVPNHAGQFAVELIPKAGDKDVFEIEIRGGKIVLRGNNGVPVA